MSEVLKGQSQYFGCILLKMCKKRHIFNIHESINLLNLSVSKLYEIVSSLVFYCYNENVKMENVYSTE